jgi:L-2,4-diaminobutyric acid acetyltransferase
MELSLSKPDSQDGNEVHQLVARCKPLDENSVYCNLLQCDHFADSSIIAKKEGHVVGFVSGYVLPKQPTTLFVWQVAVDERQRGTGLASKMLNSLLERAELAGITHLETTITADNEGSWALFTRLASTLETTLSKRAYYTSEAHFKGEHDTEWLVSVGPFSIKSGA